MHVMTTARNNDAHTLTVISPYTYLVAESNDFNGSTILSYDKLVAICSLAIEADRE